MLKFPSAIVFFFLNKNEIMKSKIIYAKLNKLKRIFLLKALSPYWAQKRPVHLKELLTQTTQGSLRLFVCYRTFVNTENNDCEVENNMQPWKKEERTNH